MREIPGKRVLSNAELQQQVVRLTEELSVCRRELRETRERSTQALQAAAAQYDVRASDLRSAARAERAQVLDLRKELAAANTQSNEQWHLLEDMQEIVGAVCYMLTGGNRSVDGSADAHLVAEVLDRLRELYV